MTPLRSRLLPLCLAVVMGACFGPDPGVTSSGKGLPRVSISFPANVETGAQADLEVTIHNPGPGDMPSHVIAFAFVGPQSAGQDLPAPLVGVGSDKSNPAIAAIVPEPRAVSQDGVVYVFGRLAAGETTTVTFTVLAPGRPGVAANSVTVYDGSDPERAAGARLQTTVG